jgi:hypothetical protein
VSGLQYRPPEAASMDRPTSLSYVRLTPEVIAGMQQLALEQRRLLGPRAPWHVGDLAWGLRQHEGRELEWTFRLWRDSGDRVVAWSWLKGDRGRLEYDLHPEHRHLLDQVLDEPDAREAVSDGRFASYALVWPDDENSVGLFEPVGTRAEFRRRGLGAAVCTFGPGCVSSADLRP